MRGKVASEGAEENTVRVKFWAALVLAGLCASGGTGQGVPQQEVPKLDLKLSSEKVVPTEYDTLLLAPLRCDSSGDVYIRRLMPGRVHHAPVIKFSPDGEKLAVFSLDSVPGLTDAEMPDFAVGLRRDVYLLALSIKDTERHVAVVRFSERGNYESTISLGPMFVPANFAVFLTGDFLISGTQTTVPEPADTDSEPKREPFTAVFDGSGRMVKRISLPGDVDLNPSKSGKGSRDTGEAEKKQAPAAEITQGEAAPGDDGNVYLMRRTSPPLVYVISAGGEVVRTLKVTPPAGNAEVWSMKYAYGGRLVFEFTVPTPVNGSRPDIIFSLVDAETGQRVLDYKAPPKMGGSFVCYSQEKVVTLGTMPDEHLSIQRFSAR
jgi:hypothetical protein